jgi:hypothetical protein
MWVVSSSYFGTHTVDLPDSWDEDGVWEAVSDDLSIHWED